ncbi:alkaline phosphatase [Chitinophaga sp. SYP-B3965]|uniref:alkaline phosphatase n=1 Tax=Chitinophaga sp. SYP-B3965 TaxID=2663120 RepID=UPI00129958F6|nr:alkaline phosphatase [Chitinophaga sp. SYP-B3965]MRG48831.1 alkaline phosphatase [Chitinophaga sp. SYP-B3965]
MLRNIYTLVCLLGLLTPALAQQYTTSNAHSHNDYEQPKPFAMAFARNFGSMEADVWERNGELYVAHNQKDIDSSRTLKALYLQPLQKMIEMRKGIFATKAELQLLIDFKTTGVPTMKALVEILSAFPAITSHPQVKIVISGSRPDAALWEQYPSYILFDGIPTVNYTPAQLRRIHMISDNFRSYTQWNGKGSIVKEEKQPIEAVIKKVHALGKKFRFWATPDNINTWKTMMNLGVDYLNTDKVDSLADYLEKRSSAEYKGTEAYQLYKPTYRNNDKRSPVKNVILLIGDGMGLAQIYAGYTGNFGQLNLLQLLNIGFSKTTSEDSYITDSAAGATAMASGKKTNNRHVGVDATGVALTTIPDLIAPLGMKSAIISSGDITDATPGAFFGHNKERYQMDSIALGMLKSPVSILIGAGAQHFSPITEQLKNRGYSFHTDLESATGQQFIALNDSSKRTIYQGRGNFLNRALQKSLQTLSYNKNGFFIMEEGAQIDLGGHSNSVPYLTSEMLDFDKAIGAALQFADTNGETLVIITADHETGGLSLLDGNIERGYVDGAFSTGDHSGIMVPVFAYGPHSMDFRGVYENTAIFDKIMRVIKLYHPAKKS